jgi:hypothetical protein
VLTKNQRIRMKNNFWLWYRSRSSNNLFQAMRFFYTNFLRIICWYAFN